MSSKQKENSQKENNIENTSDEELDIDRIETLDCDIKNCKDADQFLKQNTLQKNNISRLIAYLFKLGLLKEDNQIGSTINKLKKTYFTLTELYLQDNFDSPLEKIDKSSKATILADVKRSLLWFEDACVLLGVENIYQNNASQIVYRILSMIELTNKELSYIQGFDRYVFLTYTLALYFVQKSKINIKYAEALSYHMSVKLLLNSRPDILLNDPNSFRAFKKIDRLINNFLPKTMRILKENEFSSFHFAIRWRLILFCDEHDANGTFLIWDFLLQYPNVDDFFCELACAHVKQVPIKDSFSAVETIQRFKNWDNTKIIQDALTYKKKFHSQKFSYLMIIVIIFCFIILLFSFYNQLSRRPLILSNNLRKGEDNMNNNMNNKKNTLLRRVYQKRYKQTKK